MPVVEQRAGSCYIWIISGFLFLCIVAGGTFLVLYMADPESPSVHWYPIVGVAFVCLPWFFWLLTFSYRILSRALGFRMVCWGATFDGPGGSFGRGVSIGGGGGSVGNEMQSEKGAAEADGDSGDGNRRVHFGGAVVVAEQEGGDSSAGSSSHSGESELPLKLSMAS